MMSKASVIFSAGYLSQSLQAEFGNIPPVGLPYLNQVLLAAQLKSLPMQPCFVVLAKDMFISGSLKKCIERLGINILYGKADCSLVDNMTETLARLNFNYFDILLGDTLITNYDYSFNSYSAHKANYNYEWTPSRKLGHVFSGQILGIKKFSFLQLLQDKKLMNKKFSADILDKLEVNVSGNWIDFGHIHTLYNARRGQFEPRYFNDLNLQEGIVTKKSGNVFKIKAEKEWFRSAPKRVLTNLPRFYDSESESNYQLEYLECYTLRELSLFARLKDEDWKFIIEKFLNFLDDTQNIYRQSECEFDFNSFITNKNHERTLNSTVFPFNVDDEIFINKKNYGTIRNLIDNLNESIFKENFNSNVSYMHGDLCFSNIFYDFRSRNLKFIDPRGHIGNIITQWGFIDYDIAKFAHSLCYRYDDIIAGNFDGNIEHNRITTDIRIRCFIFISF